MEKRLVDLTKTDVLEDGDYLFVNHGDNPVQVSFPFIKEQIAPNDTTLSESGKFADAKVVGDKLNEHSQSIEAINTGIEAIKADYATKEEAETKTHAEETFATKASLSSLQEDLNGVKENYLTKQEDQENRDTEFYEGRKYNGMTYAGKTSDKGVKLHSVKGKTVQQTTNGYQLFDQSKIATKTQGGATVTNNGDGSFTISGSGTLTEEYNNSANYDYIIPLLKEGNIFLKTENTTSPVFQVLFLDESHREIGQISNQYSSSGTFNLDNEKISNIKHIQIRFIKSSGSEIKTGTIKPMLYQDGDGTWEPYTGGKPAPNPDYPMEIENVNIKNIISTAKNIVKSFTNGTAEMYSVALRIDALFKPDTEYVVTVTSKYTGSFYINEHLFKNENFTITKENETKSIRVRTKKTFSDGQQKILLKNTTNNSNVEFLNVQVEEGTEATEYTVGNYSKVDTSLTLAEGDTYENGQVTRVRKQITFDGSSDERWDLQSINNNGIANFCVILNGVTRDTDMLCDRFSESVLLIENETEESILISGDMLYFRVYKDRFSDVEQFKTWLQSNPVTVEYALATPTTETLKIPTIPSYFPYTDVSTDSEIETDMTWKVLADCDNSLKQEQLEQRILALETKAIE